MNKRPVLHSPDLEVVVKSASYNDWQALPAACI